LQFEEMESSATEDEIAAEIAVAKTTTVVAFTRKRPARKPFLEHLPRERGDRDGTVVSQFEICSLFESRDKANERTNEAYC
jgi:hypothetical protein